jgi:hypothetical protein
MAHPRNGLRPLPLKGTTPMDRQSRIHGVRWAALVSCIAGSAFAPWITGMV